MIVRTGSPAKAAKDANEQTDSANDNPPTYAESSPLVGIMHHHFSTSQESAGKRFFEALIIALFIWFVLGIISSSLSIQISRSHGRNWDWISEDTARPLPSDGIIDSCIAGSEWTSDNHSPSSSQYPYSAHHAFKLPGSSQSLEFFSRGSLSSGNLNIAVLSAAKSSDVGVHVTVLYHTQHALNQASVCTMRRDQNEAGLGIFTPSQHHGDSNHHRYDMLRFNIQVQLPMDHLSKLSTNLSIFEQTLVDFSDRLNIDVISLRSTNAGILVGSLRADNASLKTTNGKITIGKLISSTLDAQSSNAPIQGDEIRIKSGSVQTTNGEITGTFHSSYKLHLVTSNAKIDANVYLNNTKGRTPSDLILKTSNGLLHGNVHLLQTEFKDHERDLPSYIIAAYTSNSALDVQILTSPLNAVLDLKARTSNSPATVTLDNAYEGSYHLTSSLLAPTLENTHAKDPSKNTRSRIIEKNTIGRDELKGLIYWNGTSKVEDRGSVQVQTSNSRTRLIV